MTQSKFIIVDHHAIKAQYHQDLRFKQPNSNFWDSFAVRKGVPLKPGIRVLAIQTHKHSESEALFTGIIPEGYGKGEIKKFDGGNCEIIKYTKFHIVLNFKGKKINGIYHLVRAFHSKQSKKQERQYLLFKGNIS